MRVVGYSSLIQLYLSHNLNCFTLNLNSLSMAVKCSSIVSYSPDGYIVNVNYALKSHNFFPKFTISPVSHLETVSHAKNYMTVDLYKPTHSRETDYCFFNEISVN